MSQETEPLPDRPTDPLGQVDPPVGGEQVVGAVVPEQRGGVESLAGEQLSQAGGDEAGSGGDPAGSGADPADSGADPAGAGGEEAGSDGGEAAEQPQTDGAPGQATRRPRSRRWTLAVGIAAGIAAVALVAVAGFVAVSMLGEDPPVVGDCLTDAPAADMTVVDCGADDAFWAVVGNDGVWTRGEFDAAPPAEVCADHPSSQQALWVSDAGEVADDTEGEVVCLEPIDAE